MADVRHALTRRRAGVLFLGTALGSSLGGGVAGDAHALALSNTQTGSDVGTPPPALRHVPWSRHTGIYEVNLRQFTPEGTLRAFEAHLPRIARLGVGIVWLMPLQPIGLQKRKGTLGSYYAVRDYTAVNPEFGTLGDVQRVVKTAHALGLKIILDWVANHTAWDHPWVTQHRDWYQQDAQGQIGPFSHVWTAGQAPEVWDDVVGLDYGNRALWPAMTEAMLYWQREAGFDGLRCDVAGLVPVAFWDQARAALDRVKPVFMLAEADLPELHAQAFDMGYDWKLFDTFKAIAKGKANAADLRAWWALRQTRYPADAYGMNFVSNHDINSWDGTDLELYGSDAAYKAMTVLAATLPGMPLLYGGQESGLDKRLAFFEKDPIAWKTYALSAHHRRLMALKRDQAALANGTAGGPLQFVAQASDAVVGYTRQRGSSRVAVAVNLSDQPQRAVLPGAAVQTLPAWGWQIVAR